MNKFESWFVDEITKLSGYSYRRKEADTHHTTSQLAQIESDGIISFIMWKLYDIYQLDLYDDFMDVPDVSYNSPIRNWEDYIKLFTDVRAKKKISEIENKKNKEMIMSIMNENFKAVRINEEEFIESYKTEKEKKLQAIKNLKTIYENIIVLYSQQDNLQDTVDKLLDHLSMTIKEIAALKQIL